MSNATAWFWAIGSGMALAGCGPIGGGEPSDDPGENGGGEARTTADKGTSRGVSGGGAKGPIAFDPWVNLIPDALTWTASGRLAVVTGRTGSVRQIVDTSGASGARDLVYDPFQKRAVVFEQDDEGGGGEIASYPLVPGPNGPVLGPRLHGSWVDGDARLLASSLGIVAFEESYGTWWKLFFSDEESVRSVAAPLPASAWISPTGSGIAIRAMTLTPGLPIHRRSADATWTAVSAPETASLGIAAEGATPTARLMPAPARADAILFDVIGSALAVRQVNGPVPGPASLVPLGASGLRIEHAVPFDGGEVALLLISGDSRVIAIETDPAGAVIGLAQVALPGAVRVETRFFSHDLAALGARRALAATSAGVFALVLGRDAGGVHLALDPSFAGASLRGPLDALPTTPL